MNALLKAKRRIQFLFVSEHKRKYWIVNKCYVDMYSVAGGDFEDLKKNATTNEYGEKSIPFDSYEISKSDFYDILKFYQSFLKESYYKKALSNQIHLGCSPRFKQ